MLGISKDNYLMLIDPGQYTAKEGSADGGMNNKTTLKMWTSPLLGLGNFIITLFNEFF